MKVIGPQESWSGHQRFSSHKWLRKFKVIDNNTELYTYLGKGDVTSYHGNKAHHNRKYLCSYILNLLQKYNVID